MFYESLRKCSYLRPLIEQIRFIRLCQPQPPAIINSWIKYEIPTWDLMTGSIDLSQLAVAQCKCSQFKYDRGD